MTFRIGLSWTPEQLIADEDFDVSAPVGLPLVFEVCRCLEASGATFDIAGFGRDPWPVDIPFDFELIVNQLLEAAQRVCAGDRAELNFQEQGVEVVMAFVTESHETSISLAVRNLGWTPTPDAEVVPHSVACQMLTDLAGSVAEAGTHLGLSSDWLARSSTG